MWALDAGRAIDPISGIQVQSVYGGPKLVAFDLTTNKSVKTILFPPNVAYPESYLNDIRFDLRPEATNTTEGVAYVTDSSAEGRNGIVVADLGSGETWRHLTGMTCFVSRDSEPISLIGLRFSMGTARDGVCPFHLGCAGLQQSSCRVKDIQLLYDWI